MLYYTPEDVAKALKINDATVRRYLREGALRGYKLGDVWRISQDDLNEFLDKRANKPKDKK